MSKNLVVRYKHSGQTLEVLAKVGSMKPYRDGKMKIDQVLVTDEIFSNASKFLKAKNSDIKKVCETEDKAQCLKIILDNGEFPLSKKEMNDMVDARRMEIVNYIHKYYHDPTKNPVIPHPTTRIENTLAEMRIRIDPHQSVRNQIAPIIKKMPEFLPIKPMNVPEMEGDHRSRK